MEAAFPRRGDQVQVQANERQNVFVKIPEIVG